MTSLKISAGTVARTIVLLLALVNQVLSMLGIPVLPIEDEAINTVVSTLWTVIAAVAAWWKNNSFTTAALEADQVLAEKRKTSYKKSRGKSEKMKGTMWNN